VSAESFGDLYNQKERVVSLKETATYLLSVIEDDEEKENIKVALQQIISTAESIESRVEEEMEEGFSEEEDFIANLENTFDLNSFSSESEFQFQGEEIYEDGRTGDAIDFGIESENKVNIGNEEVETDLTVDFLFYDGYFEEEYQGLFSLTFIGIQEKVFARLNDLEFEIDDEELDLDLFFVDLIVEDLKNRYILFDLDKISEDILEQIEDDEEIELDISSEEAKEMLKEISLSAFNRGLLKMEQVESDHVNGERMEKHSFSIDFQKIPYFLEDTLWYIQRFDDNFSDEDIERALEDIRREIIGVDVMSELAREGVTYELMLDIWTDGDYVRKIEFYLDIDGDDEYSNISMTFDLSFFIDDLNRNLGITAPENYTDVYELLAEYGFEEGLDF
jgi:hypothetical protein